MFTTKTVKQQSLQTNKSYKQQCATLPE